MESSDELEPLAPLPTFNGQGMTTESNFDGMSNTNGGMNPHMSLPGQGGGMPYMNHQAKSDAIEMSMRSMSSTQRYQRNQQQERIERENEIPIVSKFLQSKHFVKYCDIAFDLVDSNGDDVIDETELYAGLLLIHLKLGSFLGPAACKVRTKS